MAECEPHPRPALPGLRIRPMRNAVLALMVGLGIVAGGCSPEPPPEAPYFDLAARFERALSEADAVPEAEDGLLLLPAGSRLAYPLQLEPGSVLRTGPVSLRGPGARLDVALETDAGEEILATLSAPVDELVVDTGAQARVPARLVFSVAVDGAAPGAGALVRGAKLWAPRTPIAAARAVESPAVGSRPNVLLYLIDTLRRDRLGCYGYERPVSPRIDAFATRADLYVNAVGQATWTKPSMASIFTGVWPPVHGAISWRQRLPAEATTLSETLSAAGYRTAGFVTNPNVVPAYGFEQGFDDYTPKLKRRSEWVNERAFEWLAARDPETPFFLYLHTMDPHAPYKPPEPFRARFAPTADEMPTWKPRWRWPREALPFLSDLYDGEIAANDHSFGELLDHLEEIGVLDETLVIVVSDHGEEFLEHRRWQHGKSLYSETLNVPLIVARPGQRAGRRIETMVQHIDIMPSILDYVGVEVPLTVEGRSFAAGAEPRPAFSHLRLGSGPLFRSVIDGDWKFIRREEDGVVRRELYDVGRDPGELEDRSAELPVRTAVMAALLEERWRAARALPEIDAVVSEELKRNLEALGYLQ